MFTGTLSDRNLNMPMPRLSFSKFSHESQMTAYGQRANAITSPFKHYRSATHENVADRVS